MDKELKKIMQLLANKKLTLSCAESLTGGSFASEITNIPGASNVFKGGIVSYTNEIKNRILKIDEVILKNQGAISNQCCRYMCENVRKLFNTDISIAFTGNAGPSASENKPVGLVYIGINFKNKIIVHEFNLDGSRLDIKNKCILYAKKIIYDIIIKEF